MIFLLVYGLKYKDFMEVIKGDTNELWKFLNFLFNCLRVVNFENQSFSSNFSGILFIDEEICEVMKVIGSKLVTGYLMKTK